LLLWTLAGYIRRIVNHDGDFPGRTISSGITVGIPWLLAGLAQPLALVSTGAVIAAHLAAWGLWLASRKAPHAGWVSWRRCLLSTSVAAILPGTYLVYILISMSSDPFLQAWSAQNVLPSPNPLYYLLAYGLLAPFAILGARKLLSARQGPGPLLPVAWAASLPLLAYVPLNLQRRLPEGVWVALVVLALSSLSADKPLRSRFFYAASLLSIPAAVMLFAGGLVTGLSPNQPAFRPAEEAQAFDYLAEHGIPGEVVLAPYQTANALPAWAPLRVVAGHGPESPGVEQIAPRVERFFQEDTSASERLALLDEYGVRYVLFPGSLPMAGVVRFQSPSLPLRQIYQSGATTIYEVAP
jgi:hypothetical protein